MQNMIRIHQTAKETDSDRIIEIFVTDATINIELSTEALERLNNAKWRFYHLFITLANSFIQSKQQ